MLQLLKKISLIIMHLMAIGVIIISVWPIASWYLNHRPILGVDFYNTATFLKYFKENLHLFQQNYLDFWYAGMPGNSLPIMNWFRVFSVIARVFPLHSAIKFTSLGSVVLMLVFVYSGTYSLSRNFFVAIALSVLVTYSSNLYGSMTWGGSLPYFANQLFFPLLLWILANYLERRNKRWYYFALLVLGIAITGHLGNSSAFYIPAALILILFGIGGKGASIKTRIKEALIFIVLIDLLIYKYIGQFWLILLNIFTSLFSGFTFNKVAVFLQPAKSTIDHTTGTETNINQQIAEFYRNSFYKIFTDTNQLLLVGFGVAVILFIFAFILAKRKRETLGVIAWSILCLYSILHVYINANGVSFLSQGWYRAFWQFPVTLAFLIASLIGSSQKVLKSYGRVFQISFFVACSVVAVTAAAVSYTNDDVNRTIATLESQSSPSSAYPEALNLFKNVADFELLKNSLLPAWMDSKDKNYRFFSDDSQVIVWWNALLDVPLARGYLDPPGNTNQHHLLDQAIAGNGLIENYKYEESIAKNMALYYLDWYAIKFYEGGHVSQSPNKAPSTYLKDAVAEQTDVTTQGVYFLNSTKSGKPEIHEEVTQYLKYYRFKDEITSPVVSISNSPTLACFCDFPAYESLVKILSMHNIHSRKLVSLYIPESIDSYSAQELKNFDLVLLSNYKYQNRNKSFEILKEYLKSGGKLIFDTGGEVKESQSKNLPEWFPFSQNERKGLGSKWDLVIDAQDKIFKDLDVSKFSPPQFDKSEWSFSYPVSSVKSESKILIKQKDKPLLIRSKVGPGTLYWSGMNLIYHTQYYTNLTESDLFINIIESMLPLEIHEYQKASVNYKGSNVIDVKSTITGRGILIKRQMYDNWQANVNGQKVKLIKAGPSFPGFIYIPLKNKLPVAAHVKYIGNSTHYFLLLISCILALILVDLSIFNGVFITKYLRYLLRFISKRTAVWWEKEEE